MSDQQQAAPTSATLEGADPANSSSDPIDVDGLIPDWLRTVRGEDQRTGHAIFLQGYIGRTDGTSDTTNYFRLYFDPSLRRYVDIPRDKLLHHVKVNPALAPLDLVQIWIAADAAVVVGNTHATAAHLLDGPISTEYGGGAATWTMQGARPGVGMGGPSLTPGCAPSSVCPSSGCPG